MFSSPVSSYQPNESQRLPSIRQRIKERSRLLPHTAIDLMTNWYDLNYTNPYPTFPEIEYMATQGQIKINQVKQWFVNIRRRTQNEYRKKRTNLKKTKQSNDSSSFSSTNTFETTFELKFNPIQLDSQCKTSGLNLFNSNYTSPQSICNANNYSFLPNYQNYGNFMHSTPIFNNYHLMSSYSSNGNSSSSLENVSSAISSSSSSLTNVSTFTYNQFYYQDQFNNANISPLKQNYCL